MEKEQSYLKLIDGNNNNNKEEKTIRMCLQLSGLTRKLENVRLTKKLFYELLESSPEFKNVSKLSTPICIILEWHLANDGARFLDISSIGRQVIIKKLISEGVIENAYASSINGMMDTFIETEKYEREQVKILFIETEKEKRSMKIVDNN